MIKQNIKKIQIQEKLEHLKSLDIDDAYLEPFDIMHRSKLFKSFKNGIYRLPVLGSFNNSLYVIDGAKILDFLYKEQEEEVYVLIIEFDSLDEMIALRIGLNQRWNIPHDVNIAYFLQNVDNEIINKYTYFTIAQINKLKAMIKYDWSKVRTLKDKTKKQTRRGLF